MVIITEILKKWYQLRKDSKVLLKFEDVAIMWNMIMKRLLPMVFSFNNFGIIIMHTITIFRDKSSLFSCFYIDKK